MEEAATAALRSSSSWIALVSLLHRGVVLIQQVESPDRLRLRCRGR